MTQLEKAFELACYEIAKTFYKNPIPHPDLIEAVRDDLMEAARLALIND